MRHFCTTAFVLAILLPFSFARAEGFTAELKVSDAKPSQSAKSNPPATADQMTHRPTMQAAAGSQLTATWKVVRTHPGEVKDALVHFVVVKLDRAGQSIPALEPDKVTIECALTMDFDKDKTASGSQPFRIDTAGVYLVRIEAGGDADKPAQQDFAELELVVK